MNCLHCKAKLPPTRKKWCSDACARRVNHPKSYKESKERRKLRYKLVAELAHKFKNEEITFPRLRMEINKMV